MKYWLILAGRDWMRAPIAGTAAVVFNVFAIVSFVMGDIDRGLLCSILAMVVLLRRPSPIEDEGLVAAINLARFAAEQANGQRDHVLSRDEASAIKLVCRAIERA